MIFISRGGGATRCSEDPVCPAWLSGRPSRCRSRGIAASEAVPAGQSLAGMLSLSCRIGQTGQATVTFASELDYASADHACDYVRGVIDAHGGQVLLDVAGLSFCDACGLGALARMSRHAGQAGSSLHLLAPPPLLFKIIRITGLEDKLPVHRADQAGHVQVA